MSRYVVLVADDPRLFDSARGVLTRDDRFQDTGDGVHCDGGAAPLTNIYPIANVPDEWADWAGVASEGPRPEPRHMSKVIVECGSADWITELGRLLADGLDSPAWFIDSADVAWPVGAVDPLRVRLT